MIIPRVAPYSSGVRSRFMQRVVLTTAMLVGGGVSSCKKQEEPAREAAVERRSLQSCLDDLNRNSVRPSYGNSDADATYNCLKYYVQSNISPELKASMIRPLFAEMRKEHANRGEILAVLQLLAASNISPASKVEIMENLLTYLRDPMPGYWTMEQRQQTEKIGEILVSIISSNISQESRIAMFEPLLGILCGTANAVGESFVGSVLIALFRSELAPEHRSNLAERMTNRFFNQDVTNSINVSQAFKAIFEGWAVSLQVRIVDLLIGNLHRRENRYNALGLLSEIASSSASPAVKVRMIEPLISGGRASFDFRPSPLLRLLESNVPIENKIRIIDCFLNETGRSLRVNHYTSCFYISDLLDLNLPFELRARVVNSLLSKLSSPVRNREQYRTLVFQTWSKYRTEEKNQFIQVMLQAYQGFSSSSLASIFPQTNGFDYDDFTAASKDAGGDGPAFHTPRIIALRGAPSLTTLPPRGIVFLIETDYSAVSDSFYARFRISIPGGRSQSRSFKRNNTFFVYMPYERYPNIVNLEVWQGDHLAHARLIDAILVY